VRQPTIRLHLDGLIVDSFAGGGGASLGIEMATGRSPDVAINHDREAIAVHAANHPGTKHFCESVWDVDPRKATSGKRVALMWLSPDCTYFSKARGRKPFRDRKKARRRRGLANLALRWVKALGPAKRPRCLIMENVEEFQDWGPLTNEGVPDPLRKGFTFRRWLKQLEGCGYRVEMRELRACDYGAPTTRKRLFIIARSDGLPIVWPTPTHGPGRLPFRTAAECLDFSVPVKSIFGRKKPLAENTLKRIARGIRKYVLEAAEPFIIPVKTWGGGGNGPRSIHEPMRTVTASKRGEYAVVDPFLVHTAHGEQDKKGKKRARGEHSAHEPLPTVLTTNDFAVAAAHLARIGQANGNGAYVNDRATHSPP
jgi:DNA (cytosine-5)-methyltransferase 1